MEGRQNVQINRSSSSFHLPNLENIGLEQKYLYQLHNQLSFQMYSTIRNLFALENLLLGKKKFACFLLLQLGMDDIAGRKRILGLIPRRNFVIYVCKTENYFSQVDFNLILSI